MTRGAVAVALLLVLSACGRDRGPTAGDAVPAAADEGVPSGTLPTPTAAPGTSVTGMPTQPPPPREVETPPDAPAETVADASAAPTEAPPGDATDATAATAATASTDAATPPASASPAPLGPAAPADLAGAGALVAQYMSAVGSGALVRAQGLWATTPNDSAVLQLARDPGLVVAIGNATADAAGRVVVPVDVRGKGADGGDRHLQVGYALQRTPSGAWRILSASVRDAAP